MSDEQQPDSLAELFANRADAGSAPRTSDVASAPLVPASPQFSSRREMKNASAHKPSSTAPRTTKLSRRDQLAVRKLAATPKVAATTGPAKAPVKKRQNPLKVFFVLLVISGFVGGIALPAIAAPNNTLQAGSLTTKGSQSVKVSASIETSKVTRDAVGATTEAELRTEQINAEYLANAPGPRQPGDDYPWRDAGNSLSPLGYVYRNCTDFVAWRLNRDQGVTSAPWKWVWSNLTPSGGNASQWEKAWISHGWPVSSTPIVGSVAWFVGNHVAYVHAISGSNVLIEEYNGTSSRAYAERTIPISSVGAFLYPPPA